MSRRHNRRCQGSHRRRWRHVRGSRPKIRLLKSLANLLIANSHLHPQQRRKGSLVASNTLQRTQLHRRYRTNNLSQLRRRLLHHIRIPHNRPRPRTTTARTNHTNRHRLLTVAEKRRSNRNITSRGLRLVSNSYIRDSLVND